MYGTGEMQLGNNPSDISSVPLSGVYELELFKEFRTSH
jgi:hypothetical protein